MSDLEHKREGDGRSNRASQYRKTRKGLLWAGGALAAGAALLYLWRFAGEGVGAQAAFAQAGDYFGGVLGPLFSFLALIAVLDALVLQSEELDETRAEMADTRRATEQLAAATRSQKISIEGQRRLLERQLDAADRESAARFHVRDAREEQGRFQVTLICLHGQLFEVHNFDLPVTLAGLNSTVRENEKPQLSFPSDAPPFRGWFFGTVASGAFVCYQLVVNGERDAEIYGPLLPQESPGDLEERVGAIADARSLGAWD